EALVTAAAPVRLTALRILEDVEERLGNSSYLLERARFASAEDRGLAMELVLGCLRRQQALDAALARVCARPLAEVETGVRQALRLGAYQLLHLQRVPAYAAVGETVEAAKRACGRKQ